MSNLVTAVRSSCSCGIEENDILRDLTTVPAGTVSTGLSACGIQSGLFTLPRTIIPPQVYREGLCPESALEIGTMFPELADVYK